MKKKKELPEAPAPDTSAPVAGAAAPALSYNVPQEVAYSGENFIELVLPQEYFRATANSVAEASS